MKCNPIIQHLDVYFDGDLSEEDSKSIDDHLAACDSCRTVYDNEKRLLLALKNLPVQGPSHDFSKVIITKAIGRAQKQAMKKAAAFMEAMLPACLALWIAMSVPFSFWQQPMQSQIDQFVLALHTPKNIKVLFTSPEDLEMASLTIRLSNNLEIQGYPASREITWKTNIRKGKNYLTIPVIARKTGEAKFVAEVNHQDKSKLFKLDMLVQESLINGKSSYNRYTV